MISCISLAAHPYRIIAISAGEPSSETDMLNPSSQKRASALVGYFFGIPPNIPPLFEDMVTTNPKKEPSHPIVFVGALSTLVAIQTITPLANVIFSDLAPTTVFTHMPKSVKQFTSRKLSQLKSELYESHQYDGKTAVICCQDQDLARVLIELEPRLRNNPVFQRIFSTYHPHNQSFVITYKQDYPSFQIYEIP